jgi:uncharacterized protein YggU (UPF0235/DUF167 family)
MVTLRIAVRARPGSSRTKVGGAYGPDEQLIVAVNAAAVDGKANDAIVRAVADALDLPRRSITIAAGHTSRSKILDIDVDDVQAPAVEAAIRQLRRQAAEPPRG